MASKSSDLEVKKVILGEKRVPKNSTLIILQ